jgi:hypothetical protein
MTGTRTEVEEGQKERAEGNKGRSPGNKRGEEGRPDMDEGAFSCLHATVLGWIPPHTHTCTFKTAVLNWGCSSVCCVASLHTIII